MTAQTLRARRERGSAALQMAILALPVVMILGLVVGFYRVGKAEVTISAVAADAARAASISRDANTAQYAAQQAAAASLAQQGLRCASSSTSIDTSGFSTAPGTPAHVTATVTCTVTAGGLIPGLSGSKTFRAQAMSAIDTYRTRQ